MSELLQIYLAFFKISAVTIGGGYAMLPILRRELAEKRGWVSDEDILDFFAVSQGLPGVIAVNTALFIGHARRRIPGAVAAALGVVTPCLLVISLIAFFLAGFREDPRVQSALGGVSVCVTALILDAVIGLGKKGIKDGVGAALCVGMLLVSLFTDLSPVVPLVVSALVGIFAGRRRRKKGGEAA